MSDELQVSLGDQTHLRTGYEIELTFAGGHSLQLGDMVRAPGDTNRMRRKVTRVSSSTRAVAILFLRPSRGFARHLRRMKQEKRT